MKEMRAQYVFCELITWILNVSKLFTDARIFFLQKVLFLRAGESNLRFN